MALEFPDDCPYCNSSNMTFCGRFDWKVPLSDNTKFLLATCNGCSGGVIYELSLYNHTNDYPLMDAKGNLALNKISIRHKWPSKVKNEVPSNLPPAVEQLYSEALKCIKQGTLNAAGMTLRKVIEVSTKLLDPKSADKKLVSRINALYSAGKLTEDIKDWAHQIRLGGNDAAHDDEPYDADQVEQLNYFVEAYLRYIYTLPALVKMRRTESDKDVAA